MAVAVTEAKRRSGHGWAPSASATVYLSGSSRAYLRYAQAYRFPSMFESTVGFSASLNPLSDLKPERIHSWEEALLQDLRPPCHHYYEVPPVAPKLTWTPHPTHNSIHTEQHK